MTITSGECVACGACVSACPLECIALKQDDRGFYMPFIDEARCIQCGKCQNVCPVNHRPAGVSWKDGTYYALWSNDPARRREGSSGGAFGLLADHILSAGGIVFGAAYAQDWKSVRQTSTDQVSLIRLKKSKYVESYTGSVFSEVKAALDSGRQVLYCGTSCQIDGLTNYLKKPYANLLTCDFLCHGVPSAGIYQKYISDLEANYGPVTGVDFRSKAYGWRAYCSKVSFSTGKVYLKTRNLDPYLRIFFGNNALRDACYSCTRLQNSNADITLGDFWRVKEAGNIPDTNEGISLVGVHTQKGTQAIHQIISSNCCFSRILSRENYAYAYNRFIQKPQDRDQRLSSLMARDSVLDLPLSIGERLKAWTYYLRAILQKYHCK